MKTRAELQDVIDRISSAESPVGMDAVYVHALILDRLTRIEQRLSQLERALPERSPGQIPPRDQPDTNRSTPGATHP